MKMFYAVLACCLFSVLSSDAGEGAVVGPPIEASRTGRVFEKDAHAGHDHKHDHKHGHKHGHGHDHGGIHFDHPILTEVPTPHNVASFGYSHTRTAEKAHVDSFEVGIEFSPVKWFSFEVAAPVELVNPDEGRFVSGVGSTEFAFKFASFHFEERGIVLAAGLEMGLPTGDDDKDIGSNNEVELEPFVTLGWKHDKFELISVFGYGMAVNRSKGEPFAPGFGFQLSTLYHIHNKVALLCEVLGETELRGEDRGTTTVEIAPGVKFKPWNSTPIEFGVNAVLPVTDTRELDWSVGFGLFYHF